MIVNMSVNPENCDQLRFSRLFVITGGHSIGLIDEWNI